MPKLAPYALAHRPAQGSKRSFYLALIFLILAALLIALHLQLLNLPFFWDEQGQFIPTALDLLRSGEWVAHSTLPNVHPPGVEVYLVVWYQIFGYSIIVTRVAMLVMAAAGLLFTFLLAIELSREATGAPAFLPPLLLLFSPLFYMQSMMAQLDMPAMVFTLLVLLLFIKGRYRAASLASIVLVLTKETGMVVPAIFGLILVWRRDWKNGSLFAMPAVALGVWLLVLHAKTGHWFGNAGFVQYNVGYALNPVRMLFSLARRCYYLFFAEFRWIGSLVLLWAVRQSSAFRTMPWRTTLAVAVATAVEISVLGGAELERYLLPVLPIFYIAVSIGLTLLRKEVAIAATALLIAGLAVSLLWNPPYPFPFENNYAMVDFVRLQQAAAQYAENDLGGRRIATAWPYSGALRNPDFGFVSHKLNVLETPDFHASTIEALPQWSYDALITYTRTWAPDTGVMALPLVKKFLTKFYQWEPEINPTQCEALGLEPVATWTSRGQEISIYLRTTHTPAMGGF